MTEHVKTALSIAGTDPTGGAGIQADLKTFQEREVFGMSVITSVVAQNTLGVQNVHHLPTSFIEEQLESVFSDIVPNALKSGMIATPEMMQAVAKKIKAYNIPYVIDPVMVAKSGDLLMDEQSQKMIRNVLIPLANVVTPNIPEAEVLLDMEIKTVADAEVAGKIIVDELHADAAIITGGHFAKEPVDVLYDGENHHHFAETFIDTKHTHGTGCTFSAVLTAELAKETPLLEAVDIAKQYITDAIYYSLELGQGNGPTNYWAYRLKSLPNRSGD